MVVGVRKPREANQAHLKTCSGVIVVSVYLLDDEGCVDVSYGREERCKGWEKGSWRQGRKGRAVQWCGGGRDRFQVVIKDATDLRRGRGEIETRAHIDTPVRDVAEVSYVRCRIVATTGRAPARGERMENIEL